MTVLLAETAQFDLFAAAAEPHDRLDRLLRDPRTRGERIERELWTSRQRQGNSLHEVSYRACFKPQLPHFFIARLTQPGERVFDPFSGRGTTAIEAALLGRRIAANDINPLSEILTRPRVAPPRIDEIRERLSAIDFQADAAVDEDDPDLSPFYHPETEQQIRALRHYLAERQRTGSEDAVDRWIRMVATNRLTGHSPGFFSVYTLPPNQATTPERQREINLKRGQAPEKRDVAAIILKKSAQLLSGLSEAQRQKMVALAIDAWFSTGRAQNLAAVPDGSIALTVTSPPFLDVVQYAEDNWLRCWFNCIDAQAVGRQMSVSRSLSVWSEEMAATLRELYRVTRQGGHVAFEVGEVRGGQVKLDEVIAPLGQAAGFAVKAVLINQQRFTKTANIWGVANNRKGTNTNRIVLFIKE
ncbi:DNA methyltransferase [Thiobacter aerophilum]|uniref:site-specific DNA-methyltransferase (cytosine-N(4)-specific) n=1 Tax=Thiobacter aerophilum TaxID=3121275 RepID=A0ABV0EK53_9BURK